MDIVAAMRFVRDRGNVIEQARLNVLLCSDALVSDSVDELKAKQSSDGGFAPFWAPGASSLDATCYHLALCEQLGMKDETLVQNAISFLLRRQSSDGGFEENADLAPLAPPWVMPGDARAKIYVTTNVGFWVQYYRDGADSLPSLQAFLVSQLNGNGYLPSFPHANWLAAGFLFARNEVEASTSIINYLQRQVPNFEAGQLAWLVNALCVSGIPSNNRLVISACNRLANLQQDDGRWMSEDGAWQDVHTTLEAMRAMQFANFIGES